MKAAQAVAQMKEAGLIDERELYGYGQKKSAMGGAIGAIQNGILMTVNADTMQVFDAKPDNSWSNNILTAKRDQLSNIKVKNIFFGLQKQVEFTYMGFHYAYLFPMAYKKIALWFKE